jgi:hypothetical protein
MELVPYPDDPYIIYHHYFKLILSIDTMNEKIDVSHKIKDCLNDVKNKKTID